MQGCAPKMVLCAQKVTIYEGLPALLLSLILIVSECFQMGMKGFRPVTAGLQLQLVSGWLWVVTGGSRWFRVDAVGWLKMVSSDCGWFWLISGGCCFSSYGCLQCICI